MAESSNKTILKNTLFLYARTLILLILGLYTSRVTMQALGVENYGIINVVSGFVSMFALISGALTGACQRFITFELGKKNGNVRQVFSSTFYIHVALAIIVVVLAETIGLYFVNFKLNLPQDKMVDAQWVFHCSVISFVLNLINIPYNALIIAHEKMKAFAYISLIEAFLKFSIVYAILKLTYNPLIMYAILGLIASTIVRSIYQCYCVKFFRNEAKLEIVRSKGLLNQVLKFAGWSFIGNTAYVMNGQGVNMVLNIFCGVTINAARGISNIVENTVVGFINNFTMSINPQITKSYAVHDYDRFVMLIDLGVRISFFLSIIMVVPLMTSIDSLLKYWLTVYPKEATSFTVIVLAIAVFQALSNPLMTAVNATGNIKKYQLLIGGINILPLPLSYILLYYGMPSISVFFLSLIFSFFLFVLRLIYVKKNAKVSINVIVYSILLKLLPTTIISFLFCCLYRYLFPIDSIVGLFLHLLCTCFVVATISLVILTSSKEKKQIKEIVLNRIKNIDDEIN